MKKNLIILILLIMFTFLVVPVNAANLPKKTDHEKVTIYIFRGKGCSHCNDFLKYFKDNYSEYEDYFEIKAYEVFKNSENKKLFTSIAEQKGDDSSGVPYIVIGSNYAVSGFKVSMADEIIKKALDEYKNDDYTDLVAIASKNYKDLEIETFNEALIKEGLKVTTKDYVIAFSVIFSALCIGFVLLRLSKK